FARSEPRRRAIGYIRGLLKAPAFGIASSSCRCRGADYAEGFISAVGNPHTGTGSAQFHLLASTFGGSVVICDSAPVDQIRKLRAEGATLAEIARQTSSTVAVV